MRIFLASFFSVFFLHVFTEMTFGYKCHRFLWLNFLPVTPRQHQITEGNSEHSGPGHSSLCAGSPTLVHGVSYVHFDATNFIRFHYICMTKPVLC